MLKHCEITDTLMLKHWEEFRNLMTLDEKKNSSDNTLNLEL